MGILRIAAFVAALICGGMVLAQENGAEDTSDGMAEHDPNRGAVTNLPLPRYDTLKTGEGNARRGRSDQELVLRQVAV